MTDTDALANTPAPPLTLDPFAFWPMSASRIVGLGGSEPSADPAYTFHTQYAALAPGGVQCLLRFTGLEAELGSLVLRVNSLGEGAQPRAEAIKTWTVQLRDVAAAGGELSTSFAAVPGTHYAVLGHMYGETDARATALEIVLEASRDSTVFTDQLAEAKKSTFGRRFFRRAARMIDEEPATLADPVSQTCTAAQFDEPAYQAWLDRLHVPLHRHRKQWEFIYILQTLERYGMLNPGARGLGFGVGVEPLPAVMAAAGCTVVASDLASTDERSQDWSRTNQHSDSIEQLRHPAICADDVFDRLVSFRSVDMNMIDPDLTDFDFTWSSCSLEHLGSIQHGLDFIRNSVSCLKMGGLAVHTTELNLLSNDETVDDAGTVLFRRRDMEKIAVDLVSRGHFVAQIKYDYGGMPLDAHVDVPPYSGDNHLKLALGRFVTTSFGIIVRRGDR